MDIRVDSEGLAKPKAPNRSGIFLITNEDLGLVLPAESYAVCPRAPWKGKHRVTDHVN